LELIENCECKDGCPSCIYSPKCGNENQPLDKKAASIILKHLLKRSINKKIKDNTKPVDTLSKR
jgi:DEAD/DEAH box helicase domain-containing protein